MSKASIELDLKFRDTATVKVRKATEDITKVVNDAGKTAQNSGQGFDKLKKSVDSNSSGFGKLGSSVKSTFMQMALGMGMVTGVTELFRKLTAEIKATIDAGRAFDKTWTDTTTILEASQEGTEKMRKAVLDMSPTLGSATDLARGMYQVLSATIAPENAMAFLEASAKAARAGVTDTYTAVDALTTVLASYGMEADRVTAVSDIMFNTVLRGKTTYAQLAGSLGTVVPLAAQVGVSFEEVAAAIATLTRKGVDVNTVTVQLRQILVSLLGPQKDAMEMAKSVGLEFNTTALRSKGLGGFLKDVMDKTGGSAEKLDKLFGNVRALSGVLGIAGGDASDFSKDLEIMSNSAGASATAFGKYKKSTDFWLTSIKQAMEKGKIGIFEGLTQDIFKTIETQKGAQASFESWAKTLHPLGVKIGQSISTAVLAIADVVKKIWDFRDAILAVIKVYAVWYVWQKRTIAITAFNSMLGAAKNFGAALSLVFAGKGLTGKIGNLGTLIGSGLGGKISGLGGILKNLGPIAIAAFAGWELGKLINKIGGVKGAIEGLITSLFKFDEKYKGTGVLADNAASEELQKSLLEAYNKISGKKSTVWNIDELRALKAEFQKTGTLGSDALDNWAKGLGWVKTKIEEVGNAGKTAGDGGKAQMDLLLEKLKEYGYNLKTDLLDRYKTLKEGIKEFGDRMTKVDLTKIKKDVKELGVILGFTSSVLSDFNLSTKTESQEELTKLSAKLSDLRKEYLSGNISLETYKKGIDGIQKEAVGFESTISVIDDGIKRLGEDFNAVSPEAQNLGEVLKRISELDPTKFSSTLWFPGGFESAKEAADLLGATLKDQVIKNLQDMENAYSALKRTAKEKGVVSLMTIEDEAKAVSNLVALYTLLGLKVPEEYKKVIRAGKAAKQDIWTGVAEDMANAWKDGLTEMINGTTTFADVVKNTFNVLGTGIGTAVGNIVTDTLSSLGKMAGPIGSVVGGVVSGLISVIGSMFGGETAEEKLAHKVEAIQYQYKRFGKISDSLAQKIVEITEDVNRETAAIETLADVISEVGVTTTTLKKYLMQMRVSLREIAQGSVEAYEGLSSIGEAFSAIMTWAEKFGREGDAKIVSFIQYVRALGVSITEVNEYVYDQLDAGAEGLTSMAANIGGAEYAKLLEYKSKIAELAEEVDTLSTSNLSTRSEQSNYIAKQQELANLQASYDALKTQLASELEPELIRVSNLTVATFNAYLEQGMSVTDIWDKMGDAITNLASEYEELGITGGAAIQELMKMSDIAEANENLFSAIGGTQDLIESLGNTGFMTAETLTDLANQTAGYYNQLTEAGMTSQQALATIAPSLEDLAYYADQYGLTLDDATKSLIEQAKAAGVYTEKGQDISVLLQNGFADIVSRLDELIDLGTYKRTEDEKEADQEERNRNRRAGRTTGAAMGFDGVVTGPRTFYIEPGITESVKIGKKSPTANAPVEQTVNLSPNFTFEPIVIPYSALESFVIEWIQKAGGDERILFKSNAVR
jgi:TP901 family phage tail tape measure protein